MKISCGAGVNLTVDELVSKLDGLNPGCALSFTGDGNILTLVGTATFKSTSGQDGIRVESGTELNINNDTDGKLYATEGTNGAGIGGGDDGAGGAITLKCFRRMRG